VEVDLMKGSIFGMRDSDRDKKDKVVENEKMELRKEELDINKAWVKTGDVEIAKEIVEEQKVVDVPVTHEEVVIERRALGEVPSDEPIGKDETIRIPDGEEKIDVDRHTVVTGEVAIHKRAVQDNHEVKENLKREEARVREDGDAKIVADEKDPALL
jgi:uncharacterized protein (TIGR02271 family)